jgi:two-component system OmpR family sensor kinase
MNTPRRAGVRLGLQIGAVLVALLAVVSVLALVLFERAEHADADRTLRQAAEELEPGETLPDFFVVLRAPDGHVATSADLPAAMPVQPDLDRVVADGRARQREVDAGDKDLFVRTEQRGDGVVQVALDRTKAEASSGRLVTALLVAGLIGVLLAAASAALLARRAMEPLEEALALQRRFVADASHELRTPLTLLSTRVQMLSRRVRRGEAEPAAVERDLDGVLADTRALAEIMDDLLLDADGGAADAHADVDLGRVARAVVEAASADAERRGVALRLDLAAAARVHGSEAALRRAVTALVDNALDHARGAVVVQVGLVGHRVQVRVTDDGPGVPPELGDRVFERFASSRPAPEAGRRHYGLGLALVADVAHAHRGEVRVEPGPDGGSSFVLSVPAHRR